MTETRTAGISKIMTHSNAAGMLAAYFALAVLFFWLDWDPIGWFFVLLGMAVAIGVTFLVLRDRSRDMRAEMAWRETESSRIRGERRRRLETLVEQSLRSLESMPDNLLAAGRELDRAEADFSERAFNSFWDSIQSAATAIARFGENIQFVAVSLDEYEELAAQSDGGHPKFPVTREAVPTLRDAVEVSERLQRVARLAQRDFQFATIYEQHKTNRILVEGFITLSQAITDMTTRLESAIDRLEASMDRVGDRVMSVERQVGSLRGDLAYDSSERAAREKKALQLLGQIRRRL